MVRNKTTSTEFFCPSCNMRVYINRDSTRIGDNTYCHNSCILSDIDKIGVPNNAFNVLLAENDDRLKHGPLNAEEVALIIIRHFGQFINDLPINLGGHKKDDGFDTKKNQTNIINLFLSSRVFIIICQNIDLSPTDAFKYLWNKNTSNTRLKEKIFFICATFGIRFDFY